MLPAGYLMGGQGNVPRQVRRKRPLLPLHYLRFYARDLGFSSNEGDVSIPSSLYPALALRKRFRIFLQRGRCWHPLLPPHHPRPYAEARGDNGINQCASRYAFTTAPIPASERGELHTQGYLVLSSRVGVKLVLFRIICPMSNCQAVQLIPFCCM